MNNANTITSIARALSLERHQVKYRLQALNILPVARIGATNIYRDSAVEMIRKYAEVKDGGRHDAK